LDNNNSHWLFSFIDNIFRTKSKDFNGKAIELFHYQYQENEVYQNYCKLIQCDINSVQVLEDIPFLPISTFKSHKLITSQSKSEIIFESSGTTKNTTSKHYVHDLNIYVNSFTACFQKFYGPIRDYHILALLPSYLEREGSSLVKMVDTLISKSNSEYSNFFLKDTLELSRILNLLNERKEKVLLIGVSFALLDYVHSFETTANPNMLVMETGGMKGRKREMVREELHTVLKKGFKTKTIHSEYGMTELLSQAYSKGEGEFETPPWMKIMIRKQDDPFSYCSVGEVGAINIIDFANIYSCPFIQTDDLGKLNESEKFEVLGRFDSSDVRGCNLMVS